MQDNKKLKGYSQIIQKPLVQASLCFLVKNNQVLLAIKKRGFGIGKYNGVGGKKNPDETIKETAKRETFEEIGVVVKKLKQVAVLNFYFLHNLNWGQRVTVFLIKDWKGEPVESEEMAPKWFHQSRIPFAKMWPDDEYWLPLILSGKKVKGKFIFGENETILDYKVRIL